MSEHERALNRLAPKYGAAPSASPVICPACRQRVKSADERIAALEARLGEISVVAAVRQFHEAFGVALGGSWDDSRRRALRLRLIAEEFSEYINAECANDPAATLDALVDMVYVIVGAALEYGMDFTGAFNAVQTANMAKLGPDGKPSVRADGKILKPEGWKPADLSPFIRARQTVL